MPSGRVTVGARYTYGAVSEGMITLALSPLPFDLALLTLFSTYLTGSWKLPQKGGGLDEVGGRGGGGGGLAWFISGLW